MSETRFRAGPSFSADFRRLPPTSFLSLRLWLACVALAAVAGPVAAEEIVIPGSGNPEFVLGRLAAEFNARQSAHRVLVPPSIGTAGGLRDLRAGKAALARVGRRLTDAEGAGEFVFVSLGRDPVVFVGGAAVTATSIDRDRAVAAYEGRVTDWKELGGASAPIRAIGRESSDASRRVLAEAIPRFAEIAYAPTVRLVHLDPQLIEMLDRYPSSLAFINRSALGAATKPLKVLALDGVPPTAENVATGRYPLSLEPGLIHRKGDPGPAAEAFLRFIRSAEGAGILRDNGFVPATR